MQDYELAISYYEKAVNLGHAGAANQLGMMYYSGEGGEPNYQLAFECFEMAGEMGLPKGYYNVGYMYYNGLLEDTADDANAKKYLKLAIDTGYTGEDLENIKAYIES